MTDYNQAIQLDPSNHRAYNNRGDIYAQSGDFKAAIADYQKAIEIRPSEPRYYSNRGDAYARSGNLKAAIADYQKAADLFQQQGEIEKYQELTDRIKKLQQ